MDFQTLKRRDLQALCKLNNIPANLTNAAMADALRSLPTVNGIEDLLEQLQTGVVESPFVSGTSARQKPSKEGLECSELATRTRCGTRRVAIEGADARKTTTTATRTTTRRRAMQEPSIQGEMQKNMQAKFEEDLDQSDITLNSGIESAVSVEAIEPEYIGEEVNNGGEVYVSDDKENMEKGHVVNEAQDEYLETSNALQKLDFNCLGRKDLQNFCKKNKIPANVTNAAMADALGSLDNVEGLEEFLEGYDPLAIKSPETSQKTSSRVCQSRTARKTTGKKSAQLSSALCKSMSRKMENLVLDSVSLTDEGCLEKSETVDYVPENSSTINGESKPVSEEALNRPVISTDALVTGNELQEETGENKCDGSGNEGTFTEMCDASKEIESNTDICSAVVLGQEFSNLIETGVELQDDASEIASDAQEVEFNEDTLTGMRDTSEKIESNADICSAVVLGQEFNNLLETRVELQHDASEIPIDDQEVEVNISESNMDEPNVDVDKCSMLQAPEADITELDEGFELDGKSADIQTVESESLTDSNEISDLEADNADSESISDVSVKEHENDNEEPQFVFETAAQAKATPLCQKSLRKLKKLVKEKIQETNLLAKKLEKLTLQEENVIPVDNNNSDVGVLDVEETKVTDMTFDELDSATVTVFEDDEESTEDLDMKTKDVGELLSDDANKVPEEQLTSRKVPKPLVFTTPSKSSSRILHVFDANKENIDDSATKTTETGKIRMIVTPAKSIGKLKKEVKVLLQQSEKKRPALQSRSDNQCSLTSP